MEKQNKNMNIPKYILQIISAITYRVYIIIIIKEEKNAIV